MGQKVHPIAFRLGLTQKHQSEWFQPQHKYSELISEDQYIRQEIYKKYSKKALLKTPDLKKFSDPCIFKIGIVRDIKNNISLRIYAYNHAAFFDPGSTELTGLRSFVNRLTKFRVLNIVLKVADDTCINRKSRLYKIASSDAGLVSRLIAKQLEKREPFRRTMKSALAAIMMQKVKGAKIQLSGRLNGAEMARTEEIRKGQVPLHTLRAKIDYCSYEAKTLAGIVGVKVWVYK